MTDLVVRISTVCFFDIRRLFGLLRLRSRVKHDSQVIHVARAMGDSLLHRPYVIRLARARGESRRVNPVTLDLKSSFPHYDVQTSVTSFTTE